MSMKFFSAVYKFVAPATNQRRLASIILLSILLQLLNTKKCPKPNLCQNQNDNFERERERERERTPQLGTGIGFFRNFTERSDPYSRHNLLEINHMNERGRERSEKKHTNTHTHTHTHTCTHK
jgi:hypothetical protein